MDNKKIGELIAKLRKEKGLTQQELGDKVGVGSRAVSKWECGITIPDISIINELSSILGITSSELLSGKIDKSKDKSKTKLNIKLITLLLSILIPIILITSLLIYLNNKTYRYEIAAKDYNDYNIEGYLTYKNKYLTLNISSIKLNDSKIIETKIIDYEYYIKIKDQIIFGYNPNAHSEKIYNNYTLLEIEELLKVNCSGKTRLTKKDILTNNIYIVLTMLDNENNKYQYNIEMSLYKQKIEK